MEKANCPQCGAEIVFRSQVSVYTVCPFCASTIGRVGMDLRLLGQMAALQNDPTILQLRTTGSFDGKRFEIIGRVRQEWSEGAWNEWYIFFGDGKVGWLAEAQGELWILFELVASKADLPDQGELAPGLAVSIGNLQATVTDIKRVHCCFSEGELPFLVDKGQAFLSVDLRTSSGDAATLTYSSDGVSLYCGKSVTFNELKLQNLKRIDGW